MDLNRFNKSLHEQFSNPDKYNVRGSNLKSWPERNPWTFNFIIAVIGVLIGALATKLIERL